jgi:hypothetical protein
MRVTGRVRGEVRSPRDRKQRALLRGLLPLAACGCLLSSSAALADAKTRVVHWSPFTADGALRAGLIATPRYGGDCWTGSFVLHTGFRCAAANFIYDPCFTDPSRDDAVLCVGDPFSNHAVRLRVSGEMNDAYSAKPAIVWAVRLASGLRCTFFAGGATGADKGGRRLNYGCRNSNAVLWGNPIRKGATWHIRLTHSAGPGPERLVAIRTAYIASNAAGG